MEINNFIDNYLNLYPIGSIEYQIIKLTKRINNLQKHFTKNIHDFNNKRYLLKIISQRKKFLNYIKLNKPNIYNKLINILYLRK